MDRREAQALVRDIFEEEALLIGGLVALHPVDDAFVWRLMRNLDALRRRVVSAVRARTRGSKPHRGKAVAPHPAVEEFLESLRRDDEEVGSVAVRR